MMITSRANPAVKAVRALAERKERVRTGRYYIEGIRLVTEAVQLGAPLVQVVVAADLLTSAVGQGTVAQARAAGVPVLEVSAEVFAGLSAKAGPQGLGAVLQQVWTPLAAVDPGSELAWLALDAVQDPGNLGTILRTSDAVGAAGVILLGPTTDPYDPAAVRASMGALFSQRLVRADWAAFTAWAQAHNLPIVGTADKAALDYQAFRYPRPVVLLLGSEQKGLTPAQQAACAALVRIPMVGRSDSLNLAVAAAVVLYEMFNQARRGK